MNRPHLPLAERCALADELAALYADVADDSACGCREIVACVGRLLGHLPDGGGTNQRQALRAAFGLPPTGGEYDLPTQEQDERRHNCGNCSAGVQRGDPARCAFYCNARQIWTESYGTCPHFEPCEEE